ncbi:4-hydroxy-tetrahydrodipicolinate reductase [Flavobacteriaceae bacterium Ap0902]|nr:4-hydroxy-tetrahydrodipicolinate reductase [Flavobacteriaceae bacterium Ap0902]
MKIAIIGYGKMGKTIEKLALAAGHKIVLKINETPTHSQLVDTQPDVAIEFTKPESAYKNIVQLLKSDIPTVSGTTGWTHLMGDIETKVDRFNGSFIYASNFSLGVNLFFAMVQNAAKLMKDHPLYSTSIQETHHTEKKDAPSGTAITIAEKIILETNYKSWELRDSPNTKDNIIPIQAFRRENVPGTHVVQFNSDIDSIELKHTANSREGFAYGALKAAEYIHDKKGVFTMKDVLGL